MMTRLPLALLVVLTGALATVTGQHSARRVIRVDAERFSFTPSEITVGAGEEVELRLESHDTSHGFRIVGTDTRVAIPKRGKGEIAVVLRLDRPGRYTFECHRMCGAGHNFMRGELVVRERSTQSTGR